MAISELPLTERITRIKGVLFRYLSLFSSIIGIAALAILLVYVTIDAFDLTNASLEWFVIYFATLILPIIAFFLYCANDRTLTRNTILILLLGPPLMYVLLEGIAIAIQPISRFSWYLAYLFFILIPLTAYVAYNGSRKELGHIALNALGRILGGIAIGAALLIFITVFDTRLWFLAYTLGVFPATALLLTKQHHRLTHTISLGAIILLTGLILAVYLRPILQTYPATFLILLWTIAIPITIGVSFLATSEPNSRRLVYLNTLVLTILTGLSIVSQQFGLPPKHVLVLLVPIGILATTHAYQTLANNKPTIGLLLPLLIVTGFISGYILVNLTGVQAPNPWLDLGFLTNPPSRTPSEAGLFPAIIGSVLIIVLVALVSFIIGVGTAIFLEEYTTNSGYIGFISRVIQVNIANLAAVPSVVYGLLGLALFANLLGFGIGTVVTAAATLSLLILPITIIAAQEAIRSVPNDLRNGAYALGSTQWQTTRNVVLPEALPGILTGTILSLGRAIGETAPLIMIGAPTTVFQAPSGIWARASAMPMQIFVWADFPQPEFRYGVVAAGVFTLLLVLLSINATAIIIRSKAETPT